MTIVDSLKWRYATKKFASDSILSEEQIQQLKEAFNLTATSYGLQPIKMLVIKNKELRERLVAHAYGQRQVADASHLLVLCIHKTSTNEEVENYFKLLKEIRNTPDAILDGFKSNLLDLYEKSSVDDLRQAAKSQAYLALGNLLTVCASLQIDSCPMEGFNPEAFDKLLELESKNLQSVLLLPVGKRADDDYMSSLKKVRKPLEDMIIDIP